MNSKSKFVIYHVRVADQFRSKGIGTKAYYNLLVHMQKKGFNEALIYTGSNNIGNQKSLKKLNFHLDFKAKSVAVGREFYGITGHKQIANWIG